MIHTVKGFGIVNKAEIDVFLELLLFPWSHGASHIPFILPLSILVPPNMLGCGILTLASRVVFLFLIYHSYLKISFQVSYSLRSLLQVPRQVGCSSLSLPQHTQHTSIIALISLAWVLSWFSCVWLFTTPWMNCNPPVHGALQARTLEWAAMPSSRVSSQTRDSTHISYVSCIGRHVLYY